MARGPRSLDTVYKCLNLLGGLESILGSTNRVLIKVNFIVTKSYDTGVTTDPLLVEGLIRKAKESAEVFVVESDATTTDADKACEATGMLKVCDDTGVRFLNLRRERDRVHIPVVSGETLGEITVPRIVAESSIINAAKLKTHMQTGVSLGMKNLFGLLPEKWKFKYHLRDINKVIVDIASVLKPKLTIIDGFYALEGLGPSRGTPVKMDLLIAGTDIVATDATACRIMGIDPSQIYHIARAYEKGLGEMHVDRIEIVGDRLEEVRRTFRRF